VGGKKFGKSGFLSGSNQNIDVKTGFASALLLLFANDRKQKVQHNIFSFSPYAPTFWTK
jgi:hypothetical protein